MEPWFKKFLIGFGCLIAMACVVDIKNKFVAKEDSNEVKDLTSNMKSPRDFASKRYLIGDGKDRVDLSGEGVAEWLCERRLGLEGFTDLMAYPESTATQIGSSPVFDVYVTLSGPRDVDGSRTPMGSGECKVDVEKQQVLSSRNFR